MTIVTFGDKKIKLLKHVYNIHIACRNCLLFLQFVEYQSSMACNEHLTLQQGTGDQIPTYEPDQKANLFLRSTSTNELSKQKLNSYINIFSASSVKLVAITFTTGKYTAPNYLLQYHKHKRVGRRCKYENYVHILS